MGRRFYIICEADRLFRAVWAGHGGGRDLKGIVDFANGTARLWRPSTFRVRIWSERDQGRKWRASEVRIWRNGLVAECPSIGRCPPIAEVPVRLLSGGPDDKRRSLRLLCRRSYGPGLMTHDGRTLTS